MAIIEAQAVIGSRRTPQFSNDTQTSVSRQKLAAMLTVLHKRWLSNGWRALDPADAEPMALAWIDALDRARVPHRYYNELYHRAIELRSRRLSNGLGCDDFSVEMMIACWHTLSDELRNADIQTGRYLPATAASDCDRCYGSGVEIVEGRGARTCTSCRRPHGATG